MWLNAEVLDQASEFDVVLCLRVQLQWRLFHSQRSSGPLQGWSDDATLDRDPDKISPTTVPTVPTC